jgi:uncharacterized protein YjbI with pentapeptide repeats
MLAMYRAGCTGLKRMKRLLGMIAAMGLIAPQAVLAGPGPADAVAVARIHAGIVDCAGCRLAGADLSNTCVKGRDLRGADFDGANASLMCMSYADFSGATFRGADLSGANLAHAGLDGADLSGARTTITSFKGTDLSRAQGLTQAQLDAACGDTETRPPAGLKIHSCD